MKARSIIKNLWFCISILLCFDAASGQEPVSKTAPQTLVPNQLLERVIGGGAAHDFQIRLEAGQFVRVTVEQRGVDVVLRLFAPDSKLIVERDRPNGKEGEESLSAEASVSGVYRLEVRTLEKDAPAGKYEIKSESPRPPTQNDKRRILAEQAQQEAEKLNNTLTVRSLREATVKYKEALAAWREIGDRYAENLSLENLARTTVNLAHALFDENKPESFRAAITEYQTAGELFRQVGNGQEQAVSFIGWGAAAEKIGEKDVALKNYNQALAMFRALKNEKWEALTLNNIGVLSEKRKALEFYNQALPLSRKVGDKSQEATTLYNIGGIYRDLGEPQEALRYSLQAVALFMQVGRKRREAETLLRISRIYNDLGEKQKALEHLNPVLSLFRQLSDKAEEAGTLLSIGFLYNHLGDIQEALKHFNLALMVLRDAGDKKGEAAALRGIAEIYLALGEKRTALEYFNKSLPLSRAAADKDGEAIALHNLGITYDALGEFTEALRLLNQALSLRQTNKDKAGEATTLAGLAAVYLRLGLNPTISRSFYSGAGDFQRSRQSGQRSRFT